MPRATYPHVTLQGTNACHRDVPSGGSCAQGAATPEGGGSGYPRHVGPGLDEDEGNLCWEITRVLLIVASVRCVARGPVYFVSSKLERGEDDDE